MAHCEYQYLNLIKRIIHTADKVASRNSYCFNTYGASMTFDLRNGTLPLLTTKRLAWKTCLRELLWFIKGNTSNIDLKNENVKIWNANGSREFLDSRGLKDYPEDILGPVYGWQWRNFNGDYNVDNPRVDFSQSNRTDQLQNIIDALCNDGSKPGENMYSRRLVMSAWNPLQLDEMALPPCHILMQCMVDSKKQLNMTLYQRSGDVGLGVPFNIASYSFLLHLIAHHCGLKPGFLYHTIGVAHIYYNHKDQLCKQFTREPKPFPTISFNEKREKIEDYVFDDFKVENYEYHPTIKMDMTA